MATNTRSDDWSPEEVFLVVADYFDMLRDELMQRPYNKAAHRRVLLPRLAGRSEQAVEWKHRNISSVLCELGQPYIEGYKPAEHAQALLAVAIEDYLAQHPTFLPDLLHAPRLTSEREPSQQPLSLTEILDTPPEVVPAVATPAKPWIDRIPRRINFVERDAADRNLGRGGEELVVRYEQSRLHSLGRDDLAGKVEWVAHTIGDGLGFDVLSFNADDDTERLIEVKTTGLGKFFPFYLTANELHCSQHVPDQFQLYRVFNFSTAARLFILPGALSESCLLEAVKYRGLARRP